MNSILEPSYSKSHTRDKEKYHREYEDEYEHRRRDRRDERDRDQKYRHPEERRYDVIILTAIYLELNLTFINKFTFILRIQKSIIWLVNWG